MDRYDASAIEQKWQRVWEDAKAFHVSNDPVQPKSYVLEMLPYPSGTLHVGHMLVYTIGDVVTRFRSRNGMHVLHPQGFDSFGLPAENAAIRDGVHPRESTERNIEHITRSMRRVGWAYDWDRSLSTHDVEYYRWQQWQFLQFYERGLAYRKGAPVKWCPNDQTVVANEQVLADGTLRALWRRGRVARSWSSGSSGSPTTRRCSSTTSRPWIGRSRSRRANATGSAVPRARRSSSASRSSTRTFPSSRPVPTRCTARRSSSSRPSTSSSRASTRPTFATTFAARRRRRPQSAPRRLRRRESTQGSMS